MLRNISKGAKNKYKSDSVNHIYKIFAQLRINQSEMCDNLNTSLIASRTAGRLYVPIYDEGLSSLYQLDNIHSRVRVPEYERLDKLIDIAQTVENALQEANDTIMAAYKKGNEITKPLFDKKIVL